MRQTLTRKTINAALAALFFTAISSQAGWRGNGTGEFPYTTPPKTWSPQANTLWATPLPSWGNSGVTRLGQRLFVCAEPDLLVCLDIRNGAILWQRRTPGETILSKRDRKKWDAAITEREEYARLSLALAEARKRVQRRPDVSRYALEEQALIPQFEAAEAQMAGVPRIPTVRGLAEIGGTAPTPLADAKRQCVYAFFGSGIVTAFTLDGKRLWTRALTLGASEWGHTSSPVMTARRLIISHGDVSALDPDTGETIWSVSSEAYHGTPVLTEIKDTRVVITPSGLCLRTADGSKVCDNLPRLPFNSPIVSKGVVYYVGIDGTKAAAYGLPKQTYSPTPASKLWETPVVKGRYFASPVLKDNTVFGIRQSGMMVAINAKTGKTLKEHRFDEMHARQGQCYASLALAGDYLYAFSDNGTILTLQPTPQFPLVAKNAFARIRGNAYFGADRIYLRGLKTLTCVGTR